MNRLYRLFYNLQFRWRCWRVRRDMKKLVVFAVVWAMSAGIVDILFWLRQCHLCR